MEVVGLHWQPKHEAAQQGDEADEAKRIGASQLIPGVRRTIARPTLLRRAAIVAMAALGVPLDAHRMLADDESDARVYASVIRHVAREERCKASEPCCFSIAHQAPSIALVSRLGTPALKPMSVGERCSIVLDAQRVPSPGSKHESVIVEVLIGGNEPPFSACTYSLRRTSAGWKVVPSATACSVM
jgi:hypothetical protein